MELQDDGDLKEIVDDFTAAIQIFRTKDYEKAGAAFDGIREKYKDSIHRNVLEVHARAVAYQEICDGQLNPVKVKLDADEDYLNEGIFNLNAGDFGKAKEHLEYLEGKDFQKAYVEYLLSAVHLKRGDVETALGYLKKAVERDAFYKIIAHNEPDFEALFENEEFVGLIENEA